MTPPSRHHSPWGDPHPGLGDSLFLGSLARPTPTHRPARSHQAAFLSNSVQPRLLQEGFLAEPVASAGVVSSLAAPGLRQSLQVSACPEQTLSKRGATRRVGWGHVCRRSGPKPLPAVRPCVHDPARAPLISWKDEANTALRVLGLACLPTPLTPLWPHGRLRGPHSRCCLGQSQPDKSLICDLTPTCPQQRFS